MSKTNNVVNFAAMVLADGRVLNKHLDWLDQTVKSERLAAALHVGATTYMNTSAKNNSVKDPESFVLYLLELSRDRHLPTAPLYALVQAVNRDLRARKKRQMKFTSKELSERERQQLGLAS